MSDPRCCRCGEGEMSKLARWTLKPRPNGRRRSVYCKDCKARDEREYHKRNPGKWKAYYESWASRNREKVNTYRRAWRERNPERAREVARGWHARHPLRSKLASYARSARRRGLEWSISEQAATDLLTGPCFYCAAPPAPVSGIDRINSAVGYVVGNVIACCKHCNTAKLDRDVHEFLAWARRVATTHPETWVA